ncbi:MAG: hypothetical protein GY750_19630 [Lentisphaerae bacterium]|nr:hypothetical protein [Lentisphaerota bacterium]MCP4103609.1 hypothetical protein [Lentisphaerota bacterium]
MLSAQYQSLDNYGKVVIGLISGKSGNGVRIDDVRFYSGALTGVEIKKLAGKTAIKKQKVIKTSTFAGKSSDKNSKPSLWSRAMSKAKNFYVSKTNERRISPKKYDFPFKGELKVHFLDNQWICIVGNYNDFIRKRFKIECGDFLLKLDTGKIEVPGWSYDFHYNFATVEVLSDYRPKLKKKFENPKSFKLRDKTGKRLKFSRNSYWINAVGQMRVPIIATGKPKMVKAAAVAHFAYLKLTEPLKNGMSYSISTSDGEKVSFVYDDTKIISRAIKVNQIGYLPEANRKFGYLGMWLGPAGTMDFSRLNKKSFYLIDEKTGKKAYTGEIWPRMNEQYFTAVKGLKVPGNGEVVYDLEFSPFDKPGRYHIYIPGVGRSWSFDISQDAIGRAFFTHIRGLFHQRSGIRKGLPQTNWKMGADHMTTWVGGFSPEASDYNTLLKDGCGYLNQYGQSVKIDHFTVVEETATDKALPHVNGGWWDAGDFDRRTFHFRIVQDLLSVYFMFPENFSDGQLHIPESGNGIPDIIDEAAWG